MVAKEVKIEPMDRKKSVTVKKAPKNCLSSTTRSGIKYAIAWVTYVLIGSWIFLVLEEKKDVIHVEHYKWTKLKELLSTGEVVEEILELRLQLHQLCHGHSFNESFDELLLSNTVKVAESNQSDKLIEVFQPNYTQQWREQTEQACEGKLNIAEEIIKYPDRTYVDAIYYTMTLVTTIGFGHIYPSTDMGKIFCVVYALAGVPLTCIFCAKSSDVLSNRMLKLYETAKRRYRRQPKTVLYGVTWLFLILGCFIFMYLPCIAFAYLEGWSYVESFYFTFITLTTIGFGDYIAGYGQKEQPYPELYKISIVIWIMCGLGYWFLLLNFLQKAIKSNAKAFKKSFVGKKNIVKQAEFLRHVVAKVKQQESEQPTKEEINEQLNMMALMIESISSGKRKPSFDRQESGGFSMKKSISKTSMSALNEGKTVLRRLSTDSVNLVSKMFGSFTSKSSRIFEHLPGTEEEHVVQIEEEEDENALTDDEKDEEVPLTEEVPPKISFSDLMKVNVSLKTDNFREFESLVGKANFENETINQEDNGINLNFHTSPSFSEVTLPLRDVLGIVLLVASMEDQEEDEESTSELSQLSVTSGPIVDPRESVPLLRNIFMSYIGNNTNKEEKQPRPNPLTLEERETIKNAYFETALNTYLEECETTPDEEEISDDDACRKG